MTTLYIYGSAAVFMGLIVWYLVRMIKANAKLKQEVEDAKRYGEALKRAAEIIHKSRDGNAADRMRERIRAKKG